MSSKNIFIVIIFFSLYCLPAGADGQTGNLFIVTYPYKTDISLDGKMLEKSGPLLLKNLEQGDHDVRIAKSGFHTLETAVYIKPGENNIFIFKLTPEYLKIELPDENDIIVNGKKETDSNVFIFQPGIYTVNKKNNAVMIESAYRYQPAINTLNTIIPVFTVFSGALTVNEIMNPHYSDYVLSPFTASVYALNTLLIGTDIMLHFNRNKYFKKLPSYTSMKLGKAETLMQEANFLFEKSQFDSALKKYSELAENYQESLYYPEGVYKAAIIYMLKNEYQQAITYFEKIIDEYPLPELYDKTLKNLAEIQVRQMEFDRAVILLEQILYVTDLYSPEDIDTRIDEINRM